MSESAADARGLSLVLLVLGPLGQRPADPALDDAQRVDHHVEASGQRRPGEQQRQRDRDDSRHDQGECGVGLGPVHVAGVVGALTKNPWNR